MEPIITSFNIYVLPKSLNDISKHKVTGTSRIHNYAVKETFSLNSMRLIKRYHDWIGGGSKISNFNISKLFHYNIRTHGRRMQSLLSHKTWRKSNRTIRSATDNGEDTINVRINR